MPEITLIIRNKVGLHARPAALFVHEANKDKAEIVVRNGDVVANAKSILNVLTLGADQGSTIIVSADGEDAGQALTALRALAETGFGEAE
ncbi:MAG: HPr family phosphocarrier protein [Dehalococcoidia bacterium]|nr:HPr family phosphocarrier protein [Dehalococcoidia bacterium]